MEATKSAESKKRALNLALIHLAGASRNFAQVIDTLEETREAQPYDEAGRSDAVEPGSVDTEHVSMWNAVWRIEADLKRLHAQLLSAAQ